MESVALREVLIGHQIAPESAVKNMTAQDMKRILAYKKTIPLSTDQIWLQEKEDKANANEDEAEPPFVPEINYDEKDSEDEEENGDDDKKSDDDYEDGSNNQTEESEASDVPEAEAKKLDREVLASKTVKELKQMLNQRKLRTVGKKQELIERLMGEPVQPATGPLTCRELKLDATAKQHNHILNLIKEIENVATPGDSKGDIDVSSSEENDDNQHPEEGKGQLGDDDDAGKEENKNQQPEFEIETIEFQPKGAATASGKANDGAAHLPPDKTGKDDNKDQQPPDKTGKDDNKEQQLELDIETIHAKVVATASGKASDGGNLPPDKTDTDT